jgi:hypothetical protein
MSLEENEYSHLEELSGSDYEIVDGEPDITGWDVKNEHGQRIGEVEDLLFDPQSRSVRYLVVDLDDNEIDLDDEKTVLVPIGLAELHSADETDDDNDNDNSIYNADYDGDVVIIPGVTVEMLSALPDYEKGKLTPGTESSIRTIFEGSSTAGTYNAIADYDKETFYDHDHFDKNKFYGTVPDTYNPDTNLPVVIEDGLETGTAETPGNDTFVDPLRSTQVQPGHTDPDKTDLR